MGGVGLRVADGGVGELGMAEVGVVVVVAVPVPVVVAVGLAVAAAALAGTVGAGRWGRWALPPRLQTVVGV